MQSRHATYENLFSQISESGFENLFLEICFWQDFFNFFLTFISLFEKAARKSRLILDLKILPSAD